MNSNIWKLSLYGQSIWYDNISRAEINDGTLKKLIECNCIKGITSNPSIFEKAIAKSNDYDADIKKLSLDNKSVDEIYTSLVVADIATAADLLKPVFVSSKGLDGYVSIEVSPHKASDANATISEALKLVDSINRKNVMVKIPGTSSSLFAIQELTRLGVSLNVTLIFSISQYKKVIDAYISGLKLRLNDGNSIDDIVSVASFFISRLDSYVDPILIKKNNELLKYKGQSALWQGSSAYNLFTESFSSNEWAVLSEKGGNIQRLLFASTGTKDPSYSDTLYVDELIGPNTVNTVPPSTLKSFIEKGKPHLSVEDHLKKYPLLYQELFQNEIDLEKIGDILQEQGVKSFVDAMNSLLKSIEESARKFRS